MAQSLIQEKSPFNPQTAFSRNLGWLTADEQRRLAQVRVGIVGLGGVGGQYAEILARLGVHHFTLYDPDQFSMENTNRQNQCQSSNYGKSKAQAMRDLVKDINPDATVRAFSEPLRLDQVNAFCDSIDIYLDGLDFFVINLRMAIFRRMHELGKPAITVAPIGTGSACLVFTKGSMSFDDYFGLHRSEDRLERSLMFLVGLTPTLRQGRYMADLSRTDFARGRAPSLPMGVYSCASAAATTFLKIVLNRGKVLTAPWAVHYDPFLSDIKTTHLRWGYRNPLQRLKLFFLRRHYAAFDSRRQSEGLGDQFLKEARSQTGPGVLGGGASSESQKKTKAMARKPWGIQKQADVGAGIAIMLLTVLSVRIHPLFGAGLGLIAMGHITKAIFGLCPLEALLRRMPWNKPNKGFRFNVVDFGPTARASLATKEVADLKPTAESALIQRS